MYIFVLILFLGTEADFFLWQGYEYTWLRRIAGFETAHRFGSFNNHVESNGTALLKVSPGVNGDYTFPSVFYRRVHLGEAKFNAVVNLTDQLVNNTGEVQANFTVQIPPEAIGTSSFMPPFLQGFEINMRCIQTEGETCNSNGIWPYVIDIGWDHCDGRVYCFGSLRIGRTWTPWHGGGKPLNKRMNYYVTIYGVIPLLTKEISSPAIYRQELIQDTISFHGDASVQNVASAPFAGFHRIGFQFLQSGGKQLLGRYMEKFHFSLVSSSTSNITQVSMQVKGPPGSTPKSNVAVWASIGIFSGDYYWPSCAEEPKRRNATICWDDFPHEGFFRCQKQGLDVQHSAQIPLD